MKANFERNLTILKKCVIAEIKTHRNTGESIVNLLKLIQDYGFNREVLIETMKLKGEYAQESLQGIRRYLILLKLLNEDESLSREGKKVLKEGIFLEPEYGQYEIEIIENDLDIINHIPLSFKRVSIDGDEDRLIEVKQGLFKDIHSKNMFSIQKIQSSKDNGIAGYQKLIIHFDDVENETIIYVKSLEFPIAKISTNEVKLDLINKIIEQNPKIQWNDKDGYFELNQWDGLSETTILQHIYRQELKNIQMKTLGNFAQVNLDDMELFPNSNTIHKWFVEDIKYSLEDQYYNQSDINLFLSEKRKHKAYNKFEAELSKLNPKILSDELSRSGHFNSYWHIMAPMDVKLNYDKTKSMIIHLQRQTISFMDLVSQILAGRPPTKMIFFSKYLEKYTQQLKYNLFANAFAKNGAVQFDLVIPQKIEIIFKFNQKVKLKYNDQWTHDRYFGFYSDQQWYFYKMTGEIDQVYYSGDLGAIDETKSGFWEDLSIISIQNDQIPDKLKRFLEEDSHE